MPIFSEKQIVHAHYLLTELNMNVNQVASEMDCVIRDAWQLIRLVKQKYPDYKKTVAALENEPVGFKRPKAEYSNPNFKI